MNETAQMYAPNKIDIFTQWNDKVQDCPPQAGKQHSRNIRNTFACKVVEPNQKHQATPDHLHHNIFFLISWLYSSPYFVFLLFTFLSPPPHTHTLPLPAARY